VLKELFSSTKRIVIKIIPHRSTSVYRLEISHRFAAIMGVCALAFSFALLTFQVGAVRAANAQVHRLQAADAAQRAQLQSFSRQTSYMMRRLTVLARDEREIRRLAGWSTNAAAKHARPQATPKKTAPAERAAAPATASSVSLLDRIGKWLARGRDGDAVTFADESTALTALSSQLTVALADSQVLKARAQTIADARAAAALARERYLDAIPSMWPTDGYISSGFGYRSYPDTEFHPGLDIVNDYGAPIYATADGVVEEADWYYGYGYRIVIDHGNGYVTWYAHDSRMLVSAGDRVHKGQEIAEVGATGFATGPHCHYELLLWGTPIDPTPFLNGVPAQLAKM